MPAQKIVIIINAPPYGSENCLSGLRLATALAARDEVASLNIYLMSDATVVALPKQNNLFGASLETMVQELVTTQGVAIHLCRSCADARGLTELPLIDGVSIGNLGDMAEQVVSADKVITF